MFAILLVSTKCKHLKSGITLYLLQLQFQTCFKVMVFLTSSNHFNPRQDLLSWRKGAGHWAWTQGALLSRCPSKSFSVKVILLTAGWFRVKELSRIWQFGILIRSWLLSRSSFCQVGNSCHSCLLQCPGVRMSEAGAQLMAGSASRVWPPVAGPGPGNTISTSGSGSGQGGGKLRQKNLYILQYWIHVSFLISYSWIFIIFKNFWRFASSILPCFSRHGPRDKMWLTIQALALAPTKEK